MGMDKLQLGRLFLAGFDGLTVGPDHPVAEDLSKHHLGGVLLFDRNVDGSRRNICSPAQLRELTAQLRSYADNDLLIAVDQEGGRVCRLKEADGFPATVPAGRLGVEGSDQNCVQAERIARSLRDCGVNLNLAPVADLDLNPDNPIIARYQRSYGASPEVVAESCAQFIAAHHGLNVACCLKHFPGHGSASEDSHLGFVDITGCWREQELEPYTGLFAAGFADAVMTAHVIHKGLDRGEMPATLSRPVITGLLRGKLGFKGVIVSDDLQMKAIADRWSFEEAVQLALLAGVDMMIAGNNLIREQDVVQRGIRAVAELIGSGRISEDAVRASLDRITVLKRKIAGELPWKNNQPIT